jgi:hypothetical protein
MCKISIQNSLYFGPYKNDKSGKFWRFQNLHSSLLYFKIYTLHYFRSGYCHIYTAKDIWNFKLKFYTSIEYIIAYISIFFKHYWNFKILFSIFFQKKSYIELGLQKSALA